MIRPSEAALLTAIVIVVLLALAWYGRRHRRPRDSYCPGPHNIAIYDSPYKNYPSYEGRGAVWWDGDRRCTASCQQSPCVVWCR